MAKKTQGTRQNVAQFQKLFEPGYIGKLRLKNRLLKAPMSTKLASIDGTVTDRQVKYYRELARGGVGLIIVEFSYIDDLASKASDNQIGVSNNAQISGLQWLASNIKENGARAGIQLVHCGRQKISGIPPIKAPSPIPWKELVARGVPPPQELTLKEIAGIIEAFGDAAYRAMRAGFDMVEVHGAHGYLLTNFLAPSTNTRTDQYGGSLSNRMRILLEVIANIRKKLGPDFPVGVRLTGTDYKENSISIEETREVARALEKAGVDAIHISGGDHETMDQQVIPMYWPPGYNVWAAAEVKKAIGIPVFASGAINTPELAESVLEEGKADFISLGRPLVADPYFPLKARQGRPEDIAPCIRCNCCFSRGIRVGAIHCTVNPTVGREEELRITPAGKPRKVAVIGAGPGGMEAARVARLRGHQVTLFEKRKLGGVLVEASVPEFKADIRRLVDYLSTQVKKLGVDVVEAEATTRTIKDGKFDVAIVAVGGIPIVPDVPGTDKPFVVGALDVLNGASVKNEVVVVGGGLVGGETALFLAEQGKKVRIVEMLDAIVPDLEKGSRRGFMTRLDRCRPPVEIYTRTRLAEIIDGGVMVINEDKKRSEIKADTVVLALGFHADTRLCDALSKVPKLEVYAIGDCAEPRNIYDAIHEGYVTALINC